MNELYDIAIDSINYDISWCEDTLSDSWVCDWRVDPCLVILYTPDVPYHLWVDLPAGITEYVARNGEALLIPAGVRHRLESPVCHVKGVNIHYTLFGGIDLLTFFEIPFHIDADIGAELASTIQNLVEVIGRIPHQPKHPRGELDMLSMVQAKLHVYQLLAQVVSTGKPVPMTVKRLQLIRTLRPAFELLEFNLERKLSVQELAAACDLSVQWFRSQFIQAVGVNPHQYMLRRRTYKAMSMLRSLSFSIADIAERLGFHDQPHFSKVFSSIAGVSPSYYRKNFYRKFGRIDFY
jgi:AraC-like DNA-binding protein